MRPEVHLKKYFLIYLMPLVLYSSCIEPFSPDLQGEEEDIYVISGQVTNHEGFQNISISMSSDMDVPEEITVSDCWATIEDDGGNLFGMYEFKPGKYRAWIEAQYLRAGTSFRLHVTLPNGDKVISDFDTLHDCPGIDTLYYDRVHMISPITGENVEALQFYADFHGSESDSRLYRWNAVETWEHHSPWPIQHYWDGQMHNVFPWDYSLSVCWITKIIPQVFTLNTRNMVTNDYIKFPLSYADNTTTRLYIKYSLLVTQHAMSETTYDYWERLRINHDSRGGLYEKQPMPVTGNLRNLTNPDKKVLGNFEASGTSEKLIFVDGIKDMGIDYDSLCAPYEIAFGLVPPYPVYLVTINERLWVVDPHCVDCRKFGGVLDKPGFWPY